MRLRRRGDVWPRWRDASFPAGRSLPLPAWCGTCGRCGSSTDLSGGPAGGSDSCPFVPGDRLLLYADGVSEARDRGNRFFPLERTMEGILADDVAMTAIDRLP
ncbi:MULTISPECIES: SpoIIE family protein phosphatase [unclassified Streptomyces]|uniref:SpoIIE family protein phosphatase n=1 Tax=Streptomyces sp. WAC 01420 TaxID=2203203 RepID=UPI000F6DF072|nr:hypothetical protein DLM49_35635 [Streptomyces sp. WAC 01438]RSM93650.1 hypothetical protein DMA10_21090 [Streptomyces sp. WAC 01420]